MKIKLYCSDFNYADVQERILLHNLFEGTIIKI
jgi:hypothetical protein